MEVEDDLTRRSLRRRNLVALLGLPGLEVEGLLAAGEVADGLGTADVQRLGGAEFCALVGAGLDGGFEVEGVGDVELGGDGHGAGEGHQLVVDGHMSLVPGGLGESFDLVGHEPADRLVDQSVELGGLDLVGDRGEVPVHIVGGLDRESGGFAGDQACLPGHQVTAGHPPPEPGEAVAQLEALTEEPFAGLGRQPQAAASSGTAYSATVGAPGPANARSVSPYPRTA